MRIQSVSSVSFAERHIAREILPEVFGSLSHFPPAWWDATLAARAVAIPVLVQAAIVLDNPRRSGVGFYEDIRDIVLVRASEDELVLRTPTSGREVTFRDTVVRAVSVAVDFGPGGSVQCATDLLCRIREWQQVHHGMDIDLAVEGELPPDSYPEEIYSGASLNAWVRSVK